MTMLQCNHITKSFGKTLALSDVNFTLEPHHIYGLLGRNGAGKTTLLNIISNRYYPSAGEALLQGEHARENDAVQQKIYYMGEGMPYPGGMRMREVLSLCGKFYPQFQMQRAQRLLDAFGLSPRAKMQALSTGYASICKLIIALSCNVPLLLLDEPVLGLDANHRALFYTELLSLFAEGHTTIVLSTHLIEEIAELVEKVLIIDRGALLHQGSVEELRNAAVMVAGSREAVEQAIEGRQVLSIQTLGGERAACVMGNFEQAPAGVRISRLGLQELFIQLTNVNAAGTSNIDGAGKETTHVS